MNYLSSEQIRQLRKEFWENRGHAHAEPCSLIPDSTDKTVIFNTAGMQQFVPYLTGKPHPAGKRLYNIQRCVRTNDIEDIGDERHLSLFEMMGNRSLGDYFKQESLERSYEFLTKIMSIDKTLLGCTTFIGKGNIPKDTDAQAILDQLGIPLSRRKELDEDNFWGPAGSIGPCGPCSEIYVDRGDTFGPNDRDLGNNDRYTEIWNNVFMEYYKDEQGNFTKLSQQNVDTGMGLERLCMIIQQKETIFETDIFVPILEYLEEFLQQTYPPFSHKTSELSPQQKTLTRSFRIITDHSRASVFLIADGVLPSNEGRGYVLRRLLRRMYYHITHISKNPCDEKTVKNFSHQITQIIGDKFGQRYPHLQRQAHTINQTIYQELIQFQKTIDKGIKILNTRIEEKKNLTAHDAFFLYDSCGIPFELTQELCSHHQITLSLEEFNRELEQAKEKSRKNSSQMFKKTIDRSQYCDGLTATKYIGYNNLSLQSEDIRVLKQFSINNQDYIILNTTIFYAHGGGQTADKGLITIDNISYRVTDVIKYSDIFIHAIEKI